MDADNDAKVLVEKKPDEDIIRFDLGGSEKMVLRKKTPMVRKDSNGIKYIYRKDALFSNSTGIDNSTLGNGAMYTNTTGSKNTALGSFALNKNTIGKENTAMGYRALYNIISGDYTTAIGMTVHYMQIPQATRIQPSVIGRYKTILQELTIPVSD
ncbi:MAG: hypothetical protein IPN10_09890 [Saprospiraceae bacterium]|nr:hypothetical protein [Saprospiraceae bacterium]